MAEKYVKQQSAVSATYAVSSDWKICRRMYVSIMGKVTLNLNLLTLKLVRWSHQRCGTFSPNLGKLGLWNLQLFAMYATDGLADGQTKATLTAPFILVQSRFLEKKRYDTFLKSAMKITPELCRPNMTTYVGCHMVVSVMIAWLALGSQVGRA